MIITKLMSLHRMNENDGAGGDLGGGADTSYEASRGDFLPEDTGSEAAPAPAEAPAPAAAASETTAQAATTPAAAPETKTDDTPTIPKARFDEALAKERERTSQLQRELEELRRRSGNTDAQATLVQANQDLLNKRMEWQRAVFEGDDAAASRLLQEMSGLEAQVYAAQAENAAATRLQQYQMQQDFDKAVTKVETDFPELAEGNEAFNAELSAQAVDLMEAFIVQGSSPAAAMQKAVDLITKANGLLPASQRQAAPPAASTPPAKTPQELAAEKIAAAEVAAKAGAIARNVAASNAQPPNLSALGQNADMSGMAKAPDVAHMSEKQFEKFREDPEALARARGDFQ